MMNHIKILLLTCFAVVLFACKKENYVYTSDQVKEYMPLQVGKYFIYKLDTLKFLNFGLKDTVVKYQAKDVVDAVLFADSQKQVYRVIRYLRDSANTSEQAWKVNGTYSITVDRQTVEVQDINNLRFQNVKLPVTENFSWLGNTYLPSSPFYPRFDISIDADIAKWNFTYTSVGKQLSLNGNNYDNVLTVEQVNDSSNVSSIPLYIASKRYSVEKYAKGVGLIYKEFILWEFQPIPNTEPNKPPVTGYKEGFGIRMSLLSHN